MIDSNDRFRILRVPKEVIRSLSWYLPGTALNAPRRNVLVVLAYGLLCLLLVGEVLIRV